MSNKYAPEHLILQVKDADKYVDLVECTCSNFVGAYTLESCGDHSSGANTSTFQKFLTSQNIIPEWLDNIQTDVYLCCEEGRFR